MSAMEEMEFERFLQPLREALEGIFCMDQRDSWSIEIHVFIKSSD